MGASNTSSTNISHAVAALHLKHVLCLIRTDQVSLQNIIMQYFLITGTQDWLK